MSSTSRTTETFDRRIQLKFAPAEASVTNSELSGVPSYLRFDGPTEAEGYYLDLRSIGQEEQELVDAGELLPGLACYWLELAVAIMRFSSQRGQIAGLCVPSRRLVSLLSVADVCHEIYGEAWMSSAQVAIAWGMTEKSLGRARFPLECMGAVFPIIEGMGVGWLAPRAELTAIRDWLAQPRLGAV